MWFTTSTRKNYRLDNSSSSGTKVKEMKRLYKILSIFSKAINYGRTEAENNEDIPADGRRSRSRSRPDRPPSAPSQNKPPIIRIRRERSLNGVAWGSPQQLTSDSGTTDTLQPPSRHSRRRSTTPSRLPDVRRESEVSSLQSSSSPEIATTLKVTKSRKRRSKSRESVQQPYSPEAERFVKATISDVSRPIERQVIRIINGNDPSIQSQVLLNTKTSQPWEDLVKDLGMAVKILRGRERGLRLYLETISGRKIQSYSQLRSELLAGNHAFYVYFRNNEISDSLSSLTARPAPSPSGRTRKGTRYSRSVDNLAASGRTSRSTVNVQEELGKAPEFPRVNSTPRLATVGTQEPEPLKKVVASTSHIPVPKNKRSSREASSMTDVTMIPSKSTPNIPASTAQQKVTNKKRETRRKRSETSAYLASSNRSRSVSP